MTRQHRLALERPKFSLSNFLIASSDHPALVRMANWSLRVLIGVTIGVGVYLWDARALLRETDMLVSASSEIQRMNLAIQREMTQMRQCAQAGPGPTQYDVACLKSVSEHAVTSSTLYAVSHHLGAASRRVADPEALTLRRALLKRAISTAMTEKEQPHVLAIQRMRAACDDMLLPCPFYPTEGATAMSDFIIGAASRQLSALGGSDRLR